MNVYNTPGTKKNIFPLFRGLYRIFKLLGNDWYIFRDIENCQRTQVHYDGVLDARKRVDAEVPLHCLNTPSSVEDRFTGFTQTRG